MVDLGRAQKTGVGPDVLLPFQSDMAERRLHQVLDRVTDAGRNHEIAGRLLLQHRPHRTHVVSGESPIAVRVEIAQGQMLSETELDAGHPIRDLAGHEFETPPRRFVIEEDAGRRKEIVALAVVHGDVVREHLRDAIRAPRVERRHLALRSLPNLSIHLAGRRLIEADRGVDASQRLEHAGHALRVVLPGQHRLVP